MRLVRIRKRFKLKYTRYADDLTFSTNNKYFLDNKTKFYNEIKEEIERFGLSINDKKTRLIYNDSRQEVTGLVVNEKININRQYYKVTRAMSDYLYIHGKFMIDGKEGNINQLEGRFAFINQLDYYNNKLDKEKHKLWNLNAREKEYQKFLFYKYFFANPNLLIVTEGKTDINYIKAALKKLYKSYPELIEKRNEQYFYKISFLNKTNRLKYFLAIFQDGADTMKNIYNFYKGKNNLPNLTEYFMKKSGVLPENPVFLIFDNEQESKKPLRKFKEHIELKDNIKLSQNIINNLYLITNPLVKGLQECEIEDLFEDSLLCNKLNGKEFSKENEFDKEKYYGKNIFSNYVLKNYNEINFDNFVPLLDEIKVIVSNYNKS